MTPRFIYTDMNVYKIIVNKCAPKSLTKTMKASIIPIIIVGCNLLQAYRNNSTD